MDHDESISVFQHKRKELDSMDKIREYEDEIKALQGIIVDSQKEKTVRNYERNPIRRENIHMAMCREFKICDTVTIIGERRNFHHQELIVSIQFVQIGSQRFEYSDLLEIIDCIEQKEFVDIDDEAWD